MTHTPFNSYNAHVVTRFHVQLVDALDQGVPARTLLDDLNRFEVEEHRTENRIHDQAVFRQETKLYPCS